MFLALSGGGSENIYKCVYSRSKYGWSVLRINQLRHSNLKTFEVSDNCIGQDNRIPEGQALDVLNNGED